jgi:hypothetical protein
LDNVQHCGAGMLLVLRVLRNNSQLHTVVGIDVEDERGNLMGGDDKR